MIVTSTILWPDGSITSREVDFSVSYQVRDFSAIARTALEAGGVVITNNAEDKHQANKLIHAVTEGTKYFG